MVQPNYEIERNMKEDVTKLETQLSRAHCHEKGNAGFGLAGVRVTGPSGWGRKKQNLTRE